MNDLLGLFDLLEEEEKSEKKKPKKSANKKQGKTSKKEKKYALPIYLGAGHLRHLFSDENEKEWSEDMLRIKLGEVFGELQSLSYEIDVIEGELNQDIVSEEVNTFITIYINYTELTEIEKVQFPVEIRLGEIVIPLNNAESFEEIQEILISEYPEYKDCKFHYLEKERYLLPFMKANAPQGKVYSLPVTVGYLNLKETYTEDMFAELEDISATEDNIRKIFLKSYPEYKDCGFAYQEECNLLFPILLKKSSEKPNKISLPVVVRAGGFKLNIEPSDVKGHSSATLEEIRKVLEEIYPEYSKERTEMIYDEKHFIIPVLKSSRKGVEIQAINPGWKHEIYTDQYGDRWRKETTPFGIFSANLSQKGSTQFEFLIPKIPYCLLEKIIEIFEAEPHKECAVQIFYSPDTKQYELHIPEQYVTAASVIFYRNTEKELEKILVMDIHSHGQYPAFFSRIDDVDEKGIRLYMVIGNMDQKNHTYKIRAGLAGIFGVLEMDEIFEKEGKVCIK